jgi:hypothetical protein
MIMNMQLGLMSKHAGPLPDKPREGIDINPGGVFSEPYKGDIKNHGFARRGRP